MSVMNFREKNRMRWVGVRPGHNGTQVLERRYATNARVTVYTVGAGKVAFITHIALGSPSNVSGAVYCVIANTVPEDLWFPIIGYNITNMPSIHGEASYWPPIELPAGYIIAVFSGAAGLDVWCSVHGWEE